MIDFSDAKSKIKRAKKHIRDAEASLERPAHNDLYTEIIEHNFDTMTETNKIAPQWHEALTEANCAIGDAVHNLRSALDSIAFAISRSLVPSLPEEERRSVYFPIRKNRKSFESPKNRTQIKRRIGRGALGLFRKLKPYRGGNTLLWALHYLDIIDKHRSLLEIGHIVTQAPHGRRKKATWKWQPFKDEIVLYSVPFAKELKPQPRRVVNISLGDIEALRSRPVIKLLDDLAELVTRIVDGFERHFSG